MFNASTVSEMGYSNCYYSEKYIQKRKQEVDLMFLLISKLWNWEITRNSLKFIESYKLIIPSFNWLSLCPTLYKVYTYYDFFLICWFTSVYKYDVMTGQTQCASLFLWIYRTYAYHIFNFRCFYQLGKFHCEYIYIYNINLMSKNEEL